MDFLTSLRQQLQAIWRRSSVGYRTALVAASVLSVATVVGVGWWASQPQYMPLATELSPAEAAKVVEKLEAANIPYTKSFSASTISVPESKYGDATVAVKDLGVLGDLPVNEESIGSSLWVDPDMKKELVIGAKERALEASISRMKSITVADVHIAMPESNPFARDRRDPKASVVLEIRRGEVLSPEQATTIATLVAGSIEGLSPESVSVTDTEGRTIYPNPSLADGGLARQYQFKQQFEANLAAKAESMLAEMLGAGRAIVRIAAELDFTETTRTEMRIDKDTSAKKSENITTKEEKGQKEIAQGPAGTGSNLSVAQNRTDLPRSMKEETIETVWENGRVEDTVREYGGEVKRLTVSALVDLPDPQANSTSPGRTIDLTTVEGIIKNAIGFSDTRDTITVVDSELVGIETGVTTLVDTLNRWDFYNNLIRNASLGVAAIVALVLGLLLIRKLQPIAALKATRESTDDERNSLIAELTSQAKDNPEIVSKIVSAWLSSPSTIAMPTAGEERAKPTRAAA